MKPSELTTTQAADILHVHPETLRRWEADNLVQVQRTNGGHRRYQRQQIEALKATMQGTTPSAYAFEATISMDIVVEDGKPHGNITEQTVVAQTADEFSLGDTYHATLLQTGQWSPGPWLSAQPCENQDLQVSCSAFAYFLDEATAQQWLQTIAVELQDAAKSLRPTFGLVGFENIDEITLFRDQEYFNH